MNNLPPPPFTGNRAIDNWMRRAQQEIASNRQFTTPRALVNRSVIGTAVDVKVPRRAVAPSSETMATPKAPWQIYQHTPDPETPSASDWRTFRVHTGEVAKPSTAEFFTANNDDAGDSALDIVVPASSTKYPIWLKLGITCSTSAGTCILGGNLNTVVGGGVWTGSPSRFSATSWLFLLAEVKTSSDPTYSGSGPYPSGEITIFQHYAEHIELPSLIPDPTVSPNPSGGCTAVLLVV